MSKETRYDALRNSDTGSEDWDPEAELNERLRRRGDSVWERVKRWRWIVDTALLLVVIGLMVEKRWKNDSDQKGHQYEFTGDLTGFAPEFSQQIVTFKPDPVFTPDNRSAFWDQETQFAWLSIVPKGLGYVEVKDASKHDNLPTPIHDFPNKTVFTTSMTHQLHCLYTILDAYNTLAVGKDASEIPMPWHINHCFDYIRQAIMCAGDVALEGAATTFPEDPVLGDRGGSDGWDAKHVCKDYSEVYKYLERTAINHNRWISSEHASPLVSRREGR